MEGRSKKKIEMKERSNYENSPKIKQEMCKSCDELRKNYDLLLRKCENYERHIESLGKINAENGNLLLQSQQENARLNLIVAHLMQQNMLRLGNDVNKQGKVKENNSQLGGNILPDINKFLEVKMLIPNEDNLQTKKETDKDVESYSDVEDSEDGHDTQVFEEAEDEETEATLDKEQLQTCAWIVRDDKGTSGVCGEVFPAVGDLASHFTQDHMNADSSGNYVCSWDRCKRNGEPFKTRKALTNHFRTHSGEKPFRCPYEGCGRTFADRSTLRLHRNTHSRTMHPCPYPECPKVFSHKQSMLVHHRVRHGGGKGHECPAEDCGKVFETGTGFRRHWETHAVERPYACPYGCGKTFAMVRGLNRHLKVHTKDTDTVEPP